MIDEFDIGFDADLIEAATAGEKPCLLRRAEHASGGRADQDEAHAILELGIADVREVQQ